MPPYRRSRCHEQRSTLAPILLLGCLALLPGACRQWVPPAPTTTTSAALADEPGLAAALERFCQDERARSSAAVHATAALPAELTATLERKIWCASDGRHAWALTIDSVSAQLVDGELDGTWSLSHRTADGLRIAMPPQPLARVEDLRARMLSDYDGNGGAELLLNVERRGDCPGEFGTLLTVQHDKIVPYPSTAALSTIREAQDIDGDGRPDLLVRAEFVNHKALCDPDDELRFCLSVGPQLALVAMPDGSFSANAPAAKQQAMRACPERPQAIVVRQADNPDAIDDTETASQAACAWIWGVPVAELERQLAAACTPVTAAVRSDHCQGRKKLPVNACISYEQILAAAGRPALTSLP